MTGMQILPEVQTLKNTQNKPEGHTDETHVHEHEKGRTVQFSPPQPFDVLQSSSPQPSESRVQARTKSLVVDACSHVDIGSGSDHVAGPDNETTLLAHQERVHQGTGEAWTTDELMEGVHPARMPDAGSRVERNPGCVEAKREWRQHAQGDQHGQTVRTGGDVPCSPDQGTPQGQGGRIAVDAQDMADPEWNRRHDAQLWQVQGHAIPGSGSTRCGLPHMGNQRGEHIDHSRLEVAPVCELGTESGNRCGIHDGDIGQGGDIRPFTPIPRDLDKEPRSWTPHIKCGKHPHGKCPSQGDGRQAIGHDGEHASHARGTRRVEEQETSQDASPSWEFHGIRRELREDEPVSQSDELSHLSPQKLRSLEQASESILQRAWASVSGASRLFLMELACAPDSLMTSEALRKGLTAERCSLWNGYDLRTGDGVKRAVQFVSQKKPEFLWIATECGPFSPIQNCNQRTPEQQTSLKEKQLDARKQHVGALVVAYWAHKMGTVVCWEWSRRCRAWKWDLLDDWRNRCNTATAIISGCQVGLKDTKTGLLLGKEWRVECTHHMLAERLQNTCSCVDGKHAVCEGQLTRMTAFYTPEFVRRAVHHMSCLHDHVSLRHELNQEEETETNKRVLGCCCKQIHKITKEITCSSCMHEWCELALVGADEVENPNPLTTEEKDRILKQLSKIHSATGHGSYNLLLKTLQRRQVSPQILEVAKTFRCSACDERKKPDPRRQSNLEIHTDRWRSVQIDTAYWKHPKNKKQIQFTLIMDEASRFLVGSVMNEEGKKGVKATDYADMFTKRWFPYFGIPDVVRSDPEGAFRSQEILDFLGERGVHLDHIPAEAHWNLSHVERCIEWIKELLSKTADTSEADADTLVQQAIYTWNHREMVRGFSPFQHALGRQPDQEGRVFERRTHDIPLEMMHSPEGEMEIAAQLRQQAEKSFIDWQVQEKLTRARNSKHHPHKDLCPGDLVFYWRTQLGNAERQNSWNRGSYVGPARILAVETRQDEDGNLRAGSVVWVVRGNRLVKVAQEQIRPASVREQCLHELTRPPQLPWTFNTLTEGLHKASFQDHTGPGPPATASSSVDGHEQLEHPTGGRRVTGKQSQSTVRRDPDRSRSPRPSRSADAALFTGPTWQEIVPEMAWMTEAKDTSIWDKTGTQVEMAMDLPTDARRVKKFLKSSAAYFISALKRRTVEVSERHLSSEEHEQFKGAKKVEVDKFIAAEALQALPPHLQPSREQALKMRWVLTWKKSEDGGTKPKARAVVLGFMDPDYQNRPTFAPTMTRHSRQMLLQWSANHKCKVKKGDVAAAFLQGREFSRDLYLIPTKEICEAMGVAAQSVVKMRKACYGLVEAPIEWFETMNQFLKRPMLVAIYEWR